jgi:outer membrane receptor protein involved in Fe transport
LNAQPVADPTTPAPAPEVVSLSPFEVTADDDVGYQAGNTTSGSRLNTKLKDTSAPISVFTEEFLSDFALTNLEEVMEYSANFEKDFEDSNAGFNAPSQRGTAAATPPFRVRGLIGNFAVDLVESAVPQDNYNVDRIEVSSGPNAVLFGLGAAGGTVSLTSKQANLNRDRRIVKATFGSWELQRFELDINQVLLPRKLALRVNALDHSEEGWRNWDFRESRRIAAALTYRPLADTVIRAAWDAGNHERSTSWPWPAGDGITTWLASGQVIKDGFNANADQPLGINRVDTAVRWTLFDNSGVAYNLQNELQTFLGPGRPNDALLGDNVWPIDVSFSGPGSRLDGFYRNYSLKFEQKVGDLVLEGAYLHTFNKSYANGWAVPGNSINVRADPNLTLPNPTGGGTVANEQAGRFYLENTWRPEDTAFSNDVFRLTAAYELDFGKWGVHRLAGLAETGKIEQERHVYQEILVDQNGVPVNNANVPENGTNQLWRRHYFDAGDFDNHYMSSPDAPFTPFTVGPRTFGSRYVAFNENGNSNDIKLTDTLMLAAQSRFWQDRVFVTAGYRMDTVVFKNGVTRRLGADDPLVVSGEKLTNEWSISPGESLRNEFKPRTFTAGSVYHVTPRLSVFYNQSNNVEAPSFTARILPPGANTGNAWVVPGVTDGESRDYGVMIDLLGDDRFFLRATAFDTEYLGSTPIRPGGHPFAPNGVAVPAPAPVTVNGTGAAIATGLNALVAYGRITANEANAYRVGPNAFSIDVISKGYEAEFIANPNRNLTVRATFSYSDRGRENFLREADPYVPELKAYLATVDASGVLITNSSTGETKNATQHMVDAIDLFIEETKILQEQSFASRPYKVNVNARYRFTDGRLKGLALGGAVRWQSKNFMQRDNRPTVDGADNPNYLKDYYGKESEFWDFFATYRTQKLPFLDRPITFQLNVRNAFDQSRVLPAKYTNDFSALRRVYLNEPRNFRLSAQLEF